MLLGPLRPLWIARGSLLTALSAGCLAGACGGGDDDAQYFTPRKKPSDAGAHASSDDGGPRTGSSGDAGARDASARELEDSELPDAGMVAVPTASREYCDSFAARKVHLWGTIGGARETSRLSAVANELSPERTCRAWMEVSTPKIRPTDNQMLFAGIRDVVTDSGGLRSEHRVFRIAPNEDGVSDEMDKEEVPTPGCGDTGISTFHIHPRTGEVFFNCRPTVYSCVDARPFLQMTDACLSGPWFSSSGEMVLSGRLLAISNDGGYLSNGGTGFLHLAIKTGDTWIDVSYDGEPLPAQQDELLTVRAHDDGFWLVVGRNTFDRRRFSVDGDGVATLDGLYPAQGALANSWALDDQGDLYEDVGRKVLRSTLAGDQTVAYEVPKSATKTSGVYGGLSAYLVTAP